MSARLEQLREVYRNSWDTVNLRFANTFVRQRDHHYEGMKLACS